jgi:hypothetical protein
MLASEDVVLVFFADLSSGFVALSAATADTLAVLGEAAVGWVVSVFSVSGVLTAPVEVDLVSVSVAFAGVFASLDDCVLEEVPDAVAD